MSTTRTIIEGLLSLLEREVCRHESTHRGGAIWTICDDCDRKWADDQSGFKPYEDPSEVVAANAWLVGESEAVRVGGDLTADQAIAIVRGGRVVLGGEAEVVQAGMVLAATVEELRSALGRPDDKAIETWRAGAKKDAEEIAALRESLRVAEDDGHALFWSVYGWPTAHDVPDFPGRDEAMERLLEIGCKARAYDEAREALGARGYNHGLFLLQRVNQALDEVGTVNQHREELGNVLRAVHHRVVGPNRYPVVEAHFERTAKAWEEIRAGLDHYVGRQATASATSAETKTLAEIQSLLGIVDVVVVPTKILDELRRQRHELAQFCLANGARPEETAKEWVERVLREMDVLRTALAEVDALLDGPTSERRILVERAVRDAQRWRAVAGVARELDRRRGPRSDGAEIADDDLVDVIAAGLRSAVKLQEEVKVAGATLDEVGVLREPDGDGVTLRHRARVAILADEVRSLRVELSDVNCLLDGVVPPGPLLDRLRALLLDHARELREAADEVEAGAQPPGETFHAVLPTARGVDLGKNDGRKLDDGKAGWNLIPWSALREVVAVLDYGAQKYAPDNWRKVPDARRRYHNAAMRHLVASFEGEVVDQESGLPHLAHAACCLLFLRALPVEP